MTTTTICLRWTAYVAFKRLMNENWPFFAVEIWPFLKKVYCKVYLGENFQQQICKAFTGLCKCAKWLVRNLTFLKFSAKMTYPPPPCENGDLQSIFAYSTSAVTPSEKSYNIANTKSTKTFPMSLRQTICVAISPQRGLQNAKWPFFISNMNNNQR